MRSSQREGKVEGSLRSTQRTPDGLLQPGSSVPRKPETARLLQGEKSSSGQLPNSLVSFPVIPVCLSRIPQSGHNFFLPHSSCIHSSLSTLMAAVQLRSQPGPEHQLLLRSSHSPAPLYHTWATWPSHSSVQSLLMVPVTRNTNQKTGSKHPTLSPGMQRI